MELYDIVKNWLKENGYDGLCLPGEGCGCDLEDLMPCGSPAEYCEAGYKQRAPLGSGVDYFIVSEKGKEKSELL